MEAVIDRTVPPTVEGHVRHIIAPIVTGVPGAHAEHQLTSLATAPDQSALRVNLVNLTKPVLDRRVSTLAVSGPVLGDPRARPSDCSLQILRTGTKFSLQCHVDAASDEESTPIYHSPTSDTTRSPHGRVKLENSHGSHNPKTMVAKTVTAKRFAAAMT